MMFTMTLILLTNMVEDDDEHNGAMENMFLINASTEC